MNKPNFKDPNLKYAADLRQNRFFTKNKHNYVDVMSQEQLPTMGKTFLLDTFLSEGNIIEPHYHSNASELIYCITGSVTVSLINPKTNELRTVQIVPQQVVTIPQGWWHYFQANENKTHVLTIYDTSKLDTVWGSDVFRLTPPEVFAHAYCLDPNQVKETFAPINERVIIGPPENCNQDKGNHTQQPPTYAHPHYQMNHHYNPQMPPYYNNH